MELENSNRPGYGKISFFCLILFAFSLFLNTRENRFPFFYHPDEPGKTRQVITRNWNYHHPMLLLATTAVAVEIFGITKEPQHVVVAGRWVSSILASLAVVAFCLIAFHFGKLPAAIAVGLTLGLHHQFFELAHYMKEDTGLLCGAALTMLGITWFWKYPTGKNAMFLGFACAFAVSGKYLGIIFAVMALVLLFIRKSHSREAKTSPTISGRLLIFAGIFLLTFAILNFPLLLDISQFRQSFDREMNLVVEGQGGATRSVPHAQYWSIFLDNMNPLLLLGLVTHWIVFFRTRTTRTAPEWIILVFPIAFSLLLSFSPKSNDRYFLPATAFFTYLSVMGILEGTRLLAVRFGTSWIPPVAMALLVISQVFTVGRFRGVATYYEAFQHDDIRDHIEFVKNKLPETAVIVQDDRAGLPNPKKTERLIVQPPLVQQLTSKRYASDLGTIDELIRSGTTHVAVSESAYGRFFLESLAPQKGREDEFLESKKFYEDLFANHKLLWERKRGTVIYLHPGIQLYELRKPVDANPL